MLKYSNPRVVAKIENWPAGGKRVTALFLVEVDPKRGERITRTTTGATKKCTFARKVRIVDGNDGRTYIAELTDFGFVSVRQGNLLQQETIFENNPRHPEMLALFS